MANAFDDLTPQSAAPPDAFGDLVPAVHPDNPFADLAPKPKVPDSSAMGAFARGAERGALPDAGGMATAGLGAEWGGAGGAAFGAMIPGLGETGVPEAVLGGIGGVAGGIAGYMGGSAATNYIQQQVLDRLPASVIRALGLDKAQAAADETAHPYASMVGELAPNLLFLRPGAIEKAAEETPRFAKVMSNPVVARALPATMMGGQEALSEHEAGQPVDPYRVAIAAGAGALMNKETALGRRLTGVGAALARGMSPRGAPAGEAAGVPPAQESGIPPSGLPQPGEAIGLAHPGAAPRLARVDHYFGPQGQYAHVQFEDGARGNYLTSEIARDRTEPPPSIYDTGPGTEVPGALTEEERMAPPLEERPLPESPRAAARRAAAEAQPGLEPETLRALDQANALERAALSGTHNIPTETRKVMLTEAARLRRLYGMLPEGEVSTPPNAYAHPLATEPARDLGELAAARVANPELYQGEYAPPRRPAAAIPAPVPEPKTLFSGQPGHSPDDLAMAEREVREARTKPSGEPDILRVIQSMGGIKLTDASGKISPEGQTVREILKDYRRPGLINNKSGITPDYLREALTERGWFGDRDTGQSDIQQLYDLLDRGARGEKVYHPESPAWGDQERRALLDEEMGRAGVAASDSPKVAARKLLDFRQSGIENMAREYEGQAEAALGEMSPGARELLNEYEYEPGADYGAEYELGAQSEEPARPEETGHAPEAGRTGPAGREEGAQGPVRGGGAETAPEERSFRTTPGAIAAEHEAEVSRLEAEGTARAAAKLPAQPTAEAGAEGLPQLVMPGMEQSVRQAAAAREAEGHGRKTAGAEQREANEGLFAPKEPGQRTLFQASREGARAATGERVKLTDGILAQTLGNDVSPQEGKLLNFMDRLANRIVPGARVRAARNLEVTPGFEAQAGIGQGARISGATYANGARGVIAWSLESPDAEGTLRHEAVHYLLGRGLIQPKEWDALTQASEAQDWQGKHDIAARYPDLDPETRTEEAIAEEFANWRRAPKSVPGPFRNLWQRISGFLAQTGDAARRLFGRNATADDVMSRLYSGEVGRRAGQWAEDRGPLAQAERRYPEAPPTDIEEGKDYIDKTAEDLAGELKSAPPGTYERTLRAMNAPDKGDQFADANILQRYLMGPRTLAEIDTPSAKMWNRVKDRDHEREGLVHDLRGHLADTYLKLPMESQDKVNAVMELDRLNNAPRADDGRSIVAVNDKFDFARGSKPGDVVALTPEETKAYYGLQSMYRRAWDHIMHGTAVRLGWKDGWSDDMAQNLKTVTDLAQNADHPAERRQYARMADVLTAMEEQRRAAYMPMMRFGDYFFSVKPKVGADMTSEGGFPETKWFEMVERPPLAEYSLRGTLGGKITRPGELPDYAKAKMAELQGRFPPDQYDIEHGWLFRKPSALRDLNIPAVEKLFNLMEGGVLDRLKSEESLGGAANKAEARAAAAKRYDDLFNEMVDAIHQEMYENLKAGFKRKSNTVPGYSGDFSRALGSYVNWTSGHVANNLHQDAIDRAYQDIQDRHPHPSIRQFWKRWKEDEESPSSPISKASAAVNQLGFLYTLAWNPASTMSIMMHGPNYAIPVLSTGIDIGRPAHTFSGAYRDALAGLTADTEHGVHVDPLKAGRTADERAFLKRMADEGELHARGADDVRSMAEKGASLWGENAPLVRRAMDIASSNIGAADQMNRIAVALSAYRLAKGGNLGRMAKAWGENQVWRDMAHTHGATPETMGRFLLSQGVGEWGHEARSEAGRSPVGRLAVSLHGFQIRFMSNLAKQAFRQGPAGRLALTWTLAALWAGAGLQGLPFVQDAENATDALWKAATGRDPMTAYRLRQYLADSGLGKVGADLVLRGPLSLGLGVDMSSRLGFGDVVTRDLGPWIGAGEQAALTVPSIVEGIFQGTQKLSASHQGLRAIAEPLPAAIRHPLTAAAERQTGYKSQSGRTTYLPPSKVTPADTIATGLGFTPLDVKRAEENSEYRYRARRAHGIVPPNMTPLRRSGGVLSSRRTERIGR